MRARQYFIVAAGSQTNIRYRTCRVICRYPWRFLEKQKLTFTVWNELYHVLSWPSAFLDNSARFLIMIKAYCIVFSNAKMIADLADYIAREVIIGARIPDHAKRAH